MPPRACTPASGPIAMRMITATRIGESTGRSDGIIISLIAAVVSMSTALL